MRNCSLRLFLTLVFISHFLNFSFSQSLTLVELNCENLFDTRHDSLKQDQEYLPEAVRHWTDKRYWRKLNNIGQELLSTCSDGVPDLVALCEVENDSVLNDLCHRSLLRNADYEYVMTQSPDLRGVDVALLYQPMTFALDTAFALRVEPVADMRPTRDILYASGRVISGDTLHIYVVHAPSRYGGERHSRPFRQAVARRLCQSLDSLRSLSPQAHVLIAGDFNDSADSPALQQLEKHGLRNLTREAEGENGARGTYRYQGEWGSLDHVFGSPTIVSFINSVFIHAPLFLLEKDSQYGGWRPRRTYNGMRYQLGYSDHLPLVVRLRLQP